MKQKFLLGKLSKEDSLNTIQNYIKEVLKVRGFEDQRIEESLLLLTEEVGKLTKSIRKENTSMLIDKNKLNYDDTIESEIADVFIVLVSICNTLNINLYDSFISKEKMNTK